ncbi:hypothetical protein RHSIM_Rhsim04G0235500 [Rhododendron simsii]|uniref:N-acetyltransferase domain-containing protein n=1 Tax=Rhododendron simsii TaxID=118357 RepID=A0A834H0L1_RHOSS|nr:hypothetical protein RHSIM_Rhsim04G0235500 [Rhododendron simsii]
MDENTGNMILIREFDENKGVEVVMKLEKSCETGAQKGMSIISNISGHPLSRIRFYHVHVMLVSESNYDTLSLFFWVINHKARTNRKKRIFHPPESCLFLLRRMGIGSKLIQSMEEWLKRNGAQYTSLATEEKNVASRNLFTLRCNYIKSSSLVIYLQPVSLLPKNLAQGITIERLSINQAIPFYNNHLQAKDIYPADIDKILKENLSLGTWVCYVKEEGWIDLHNKEKTKDTGSKTASSWVIFSIWNKCEACNLQVRSNELKFTLSKARVKIIPCLKMQRRESTKRPFGFFLLYGIHGEGERLGDLMESIWGFASRLAENVKECKAIMVELGVSDPLREFVPKSSTMSCINDLWYLKRVNSHGYEDEDDMVAKGPMGNVFVDPRDF